MAMASASTVIGSGSVSGSEEVWKECAKWLTRCDVLRSDHRANWPTAGIVDLATILRDGVLLCNLLNILDPGCIDFKDVNQKPQMAQFLCLRNITTFLDTCRDIFAIKETDLFDPLMLFDLTNFHRVLCTLSKVSNSSKALRKVAPGFSAHKNGSKEDIYQSLQAIDAPAAHSSELHWNTLEHSEHTEYGTYYTHIHNEEIYQDLCSVTQTSTSVPVEKRDHVIKELLDTENNYVDVLKKLKLYFLRPLSYIIKPQHVEIIFKNIPELYDIHVGFLNQLRDFYTDGKPKLSDVFLNWREKFLIYGSYCANLPDAQATLQDICDKDEIVNQEVIKCQLEANHGKFKLRDVLSVPMQRILKYHLLLQKLIEETSHNHEEYKSLVRAREAMVDVAAYINEVKRDSDQLLLLTQLRDNITDWNIGEEQPPHTLHQYGRLLKDGELRIKSHDDHKIHTRYVFIFDRIILLCKPIRGNQFSFKESLLLCEYYVEDVSSRPVLNREARWSYQWLLVKRNKATVYTLSTRTLELKRKMVKAIQEALDNLEPAALRNTSHHFHMHTFDKPATCNRCSKFLKGLLYQGYLCKVCGIAVHKECIGQSGRCAGVSACAPAVGVPVPVLQSQSQSGPVPVSVPVPVHVHSELDDVLRAQLWFAGEMQREAAAHALQPRHAGTYLLRVRPHGGDARYALSLKTNDTVRHMRVFTKKIEHVQHFYLSESRFFRSVLELVRFYQHTSLRENYERLEENARLQWPYRQLLALVENEWQPSASPSPSPSPSPLSPSPVSPSPSPYPQLPLQPGTHVLVINTDQHNNNTAEYWKGRYTNTLQVGFFPKRCVRVLREVTHDLE